MAELADAQASGACGSNIVWVQVPSSAFYSAKPNRRIPVSRCFMYGRQMPDGPLSKAAKLLIILFDPLLAFFQNHAIINVMGI